MPQVNTYTLRRQEDYDDQEIMFLLDPPWMPVEPDADAVDVTVTLDGGTWRDMGKPDEVVVQISPRKEDPNGLVEATQPPDIPTL